jgi:hypothetical protein
MMANHPLFRGLAVAALHVALVLSIGGKLLYDRARLPRQWVRAEPFDPNLPIRGRYVRLQVEVPGADGQQQPRRERIAYFIPEHVPDPSIRRPGEELWAEVTLPEKGPPRPVRLGVKKDGVLTPLELD